MPSDWFIDQVAGHSLEQERHQRGAILLGQRWKNLAKLDDVSATKIRRRLHAGEDDRDASGLRGLDHLREVAAQLIGRQAT